MFTSKTIQTRATAALCRCVPVYGQAIQEAKQAKARVRLPRENFNDCEEMDFALFGKQPWFDPIFWGGWSDLGCTRTNDVPCIVYGREGLDGLEKISPSA